MAWYPTYRDRSDAGLRLAVRLARYAKRPDVLVLALPRGGVPIAYEISRALHLPLDVFVARKLGVPYQPEVAMGAVASGGVRVLDREMIRAVGLDETELEEITKAEMAEVARRERLYRGDQPPPEVEGHTIILVDDGLATGATLRAAIAALRVRNPARIVVAVPTGAIDTVRAITREADEVVCPSTPYPFRAVGFDYAAFPQTSDEEVRELLARAPRPATAGAA